MIAADLLLRWAHILGAIILIGGVFFWRFAYLPAHDGASESEAATAMRSRWSKWVMGASFLLLVSGLINFVRIVQRYEIDDSAFPGALYHMLFGIKFLLAFVVFFLAAAVSGRRRLAQRLRQRESFWLTILILASVGIVCLAGMMKLAKRSDKVAQSAKPDPIAVVLQDRDRPGPSFAFHSAPSQLS